MMLDKVLEQARHIKLAVFDVDGVMTSGRLIMGEDGTEFKEFHSQDGLGMQLLKASGVETAIITGRMSKAASMRAETTGIGYYYQGVENKLEALMDVLQKTGLAATQCAYMGDDVVDLPPMRQCGLALTVPGAHMLAKRYAHYITHREAGNGAVREVCELLMQAQGTFDAQMAQYIE